MNFFVKVNYVFKSRSLDKYATCFNDPHCKTFDGQWFELHQAGEFQMYENTETQTRVNIFYHLKSNKSIKYFLFRSMLKVHFARRDLHHIV